MLKTVGVGIIGAGAIALANHLPGLKLAAAAKVVAVCDANPATLEHAARTTGGRAYSDHQALLADPEVDAVLIATPNYVHAQAALDAAAAGKHILCEKPLALDFPTALKMYQAAEKAGVRHMTAFTYRFVPAMRYMEKLIAAGAIGTPFHFRAQRFQDWGTRPLGWRQMKKLAGTGEMGDMLSHRIDYGHLLIGPIEKLVANVRNFHPTRGDQPSDVDDWVGVIAEFEAGATGMLESTKLASGRGEGHRGQDIVEVNGSEGTIVYSTQKPLELQIGKRGDADLHREDVPREFLVWPGSPRDPNHGDPLATFRYDQDFEFIDAIVNNRPCRPSLKEGAAVQAVMDACLQSAETRTWVAPAKVV